METDPWPKTVPLLCPLWLDFLWRSYKKGSTVEIILKPLPCQAFLVSAVPSHFLCCLCSSPCTRCSQHTEANFFHLFLAASFAEQWRKDQWFVNVKLYNNNTGNLWSAYPLAQGTEQYRLNTDMYIEIMNVVKEKKKENVLINTAGWRCTGIDDYAHTHTHTHTHTHSHKHTHTCMHTHYTDCMLYWMLLSSISYSKKIVVPPSRARESQLTCLQCSTGYFGILHKAKHTVATLTGRDRNEGEKLTILACTLFPFLEPLS